MVLDFACLIKIVNIQVQLVLGIIRMVDEALIEQVGKILEC